MAGIKIEGDLSQLSEPQIKFIQSVIEKHGYVNNKVTIEPIGKAGDNYVANVKRIIIDDGKGGTFKMVAKIAPFHEQLRLMANTELLFRNEHIMYTKVLPKFTQLEQAAEIPSEERLRYAACYGSSQDAPHEVILLEDLVESKFEMLDRFKSLDIDCIKSVLKNFALLHSLSYALRYKEPTLFDEIQNSLFDLWGFLNTQEEAKQYFMMLEENAIMMLEDDSHKKAVNGAITSALKEVTKIAKFEKESKHTIIQQGDSWNNNIMFKFDGDILLGSIMIDYQLSKPTNPASDILYMIFNCTNHEMRAEHFHDWIDYYHSELDKSLSNYGLKANFVFPRDQLDADLKRYGKMLFGLSLILAATLSLSTEEASAMKEAMESANVDTMMQTSAGIKNEKTLAILKTRIEGLIKTCYQFGFI